MSTIVKIFKRIGLLSLLVAGMVVGAMSPVHAESPADFSGIKRYLLEKSAALQTASAKIQSAAADYYAVVQAVSFNYPASIKAAQAPLARAKAAWIVASPLYEQIEGIVAGVPSLAEFDIILDAGSSAETDPSKAVPFDLKLPDGRTLPKPGNLFSVLESSLWGTRPDYVALGEVDLDEDGKVSFGEVLPDANVVKAAADLMQQYAAELTAAAEKWSPTEQDVFTALVVMLPTMSEYFESWQQSRFVAGTTASQAEFNVISRLADIEDILSGLAVITKGASPLISSVDPARDQQITQGLNDLIAFVSDLREAERDGKVFTAEEAEVLGSEAQARASAIAGQIAQTAAQLKIELPQ